MAGAVEVDVDGAVEVDLVGRDASLDDVRVRHMGTEGQASAGPEAVADGWVGDQEVEAAVARVGTGGDVPAADEGGVGHHGDRAPPPLPAGDEVGDEPMEPAIEQGGAQVDGHVGRVVVAQPIGVRSPAEGAGEITAGEAQPRRWFAGAASLGDDGCRRGVVGHPHGIVGDRGRFPPVDAASDPVHGTSTAPDAATTPR